jgi:hypothetical protein
VQGGKTLRKHESRRITPWDEVAGLTPTQSFLKKHYQDHYAERHVAIRDSDEAALIDSCVPIRCPHCGSEKFKKYGHTASGVQRYKPKLAVTDAGTRVSVVAGVPFRARAEFVVTVQHVFEAIRLGFALYHAFCELNQSRALGVIQRISPGSQAPGSSSGSHTVLHLLENGGEIPLFFGEVDAKPSKHNTPNSPNELKAGLKQNVRISS